MNECNTVNATAIPLVCTVGQRAARIPVAVVAAADDEGKSRTDHVARTYDDLDVQYYTIAV